MINVPLSPTYHPLQSYMRHQRYIAIEGADGVGKSTVARKLVDYINAHMSDGYCKQVDGARLPNAILHTQPTNGPVGVLIRQLLRTDGFDPTALQLLFTADRIASSSELRARLEEGHHVISDRCELSNAVYFAALKPRFKCMSCGEEVEKGSATGSHVQRWVYRKDEQDELIWVDVWRHSRGCDVDLFDVHQERIRTALGWNKWALRPSLILLLDADQSVTESRLANRGRPTDSTEVGAVRRRAHDIYERIAWSNHFAKKAMFPDVDIIPMIANEPIDKVFDKCLSQFIWNVHEWGKDDAVESSPNLPNHLIPTFHANNQ